jgi:hypothetical protein
MRVLATDAVRFTELTPALVRMFGAVYDVASRWPSPQPAEIYITAILNGKHSKNSRHYKNEALDLYTAHSDVFVGVERFASELRTVLGERWTVLHEDPGTPNAHLHIQPKKGTTYP